MPIGRAINVLEIYVTNFESTGLSQQLLKTIGYLEFKDPTPIQAEAIPALLDGKDVMGLAQTGTGKTAAFGLPLVQNLLALDTEAPRKCANALILAPTRELALQITDNIRLYIRGTKLKVNVIVGGSNIQRQKQKMQNGTDIIIATPGRLNDLLERGAVKLEATQFLILDEADQMLDLGFIGTLKKFASLLPHKRQTLLFSATMPKLMAELSGTFLTDPVRIETNPVGQAADTVQQSVHFLNYPQKVEKLGTCLEETSTGSSIVFVRTKFGVDKIAKALCERGLNAVSIHGDKRQSERNQALQAFRSGEADILVATDVAARGIHVSSVTQVYNFDLPEVAENYIHRIGRTGRAGESGEAISFCAPHEANLLNAIEKLMDKEISVASGERPAAFKEEKGGRRRGRNKPSGGRGDNRRRDNNGSRKKDDRRSFSKNKDGARKERKSDDFENKKPRFEGEDRPFEKRKPKRNNDKPFRDDKKKSQFKRDDNERFDEKKRKRKFDDNADFGKKKFAKKSDFSEDKPKKKQNRQFVKDEGENAQKSFKSKRPSTTQNRDDRPKKSNYKKKTFASSGGVPVRSNKKPKRKTA